MEGEEGICLDVCLFFENVFFLSLFFSRPSPPGLGYDMIIGNFLKVETLTFEESFFPFFFFVLSNCFFFCFGTITFRFWMRRWI